ncbi:MAG: hypothetical protein HQL70_00915 [Magnetococcales bacterium]|nr:hypothetical protein [Magnetococcales bacterium]
MLVPSSAPSTSVVYANSSASSSVETTATTDSTSRPADSVKFSQSGLAASSGEKLSTRNPAAYSNEVRLKNDLSRILMETLFGKEGSDDEESKNIEDKLLAEVETDLSQEQAAVDSLV